MRWPSQLRRRLCIVMLHSSVLVLVYSSMLVIFLGQCMPRIFLRCLLWNVFTAFPNLLVRVHSSRIHRSTTENFCWDEIRPRDWLNMTHPLSLRRQK